ncbi:PDZ domain-containing protein [candidate division WOR-3 bacterium]|uniref:PDZ domain-containing protein n=1 Tax=candidate division WOR-3 bacterium TaxID=2052148 RepID=A0A9D5K8W8_UNCW3|nr:PDZ domain-containing protein [candidate division WOR-3 bacterium]MBD3364502.1 PDZ domain-containing protein [candidate division WOR-3 bacterium]
MMIPEIINKGPGIRKARSAGLSGLAIILSVLSAAALGRAQESDAALPRDSLESLTTTARRTGLVIAAEKVMPSVVSITVLQTKTYAYTPFSFFDKFFGEMFPYEFPHEYKREIQGLGSGLIVSSEGKVITNAHVVKDATRIKITLSNGRNFDAEVLGLDEALDLALLEIQDSPPDLQAAGFGNSDDLMIGEWAIALGDPFGFLIADANPSVTVGVISATGRRVQTGEGKRFSYSGVIQTDAAINPGNSGGPLANILGEIIGINTFIFTQSGGSEGIGFAIPANQVKKFIYELERHKERRLAWLGLGVQTLTSDMSRALGIPGVSGIIISNVFDDTPARDADLEEGWVITSANGINYVSEADWQMMEQGLFVGDTIFIEGVTDEGEPFTRRLAAGEYEAPAEDEIPSLGLDVMDIDPVTRYRYNIRSQEGALVTEVKTNSAGADLGLRPGDVILAFGQHQVTGVKDLKRAVSANKNPDSVIVEREGGRYRLYRGYY